MKRKKKKVSTHEGEKRIFNENSAKYGLVGGGDRNKNRTTDGLRAE